MKRDVIREACAFDPLLNKMWDDYEIYGSCSNLKNVFLGLRENGKPLVDSLAYFFILCVATNDKNILFDGGVAMDIRSSLKFHAFGELGVLRSVN